MKILNKKLIRDLRQAKGQFISVLVIVIIGVMFYSGINSTFKNMSAACEEYYRDYRFGDVWAYFYRAPENIEQKVKGLPFVEMATGRVVQDANIELSGENGVVRLITLPDRKTEIVNDIAIKSGRYFSDDENNQCLVEEGFYKAHGLKSGDYISPVINGKKVKLKVVGSAINPEYVYAIKDSGDIMMDNRKFGVVYIKKSFGQGLLGFEGSINNIAVTLKEGYDLEKSKDEIEKLLKQFALSGIIDRDTQLSNKMVKEELEGYQSIGAAFPVIFFIVAAVIIFITMGRMVENQRGQIGVLKAFGFNNFQVLLHYLSYSVFIALLGSIIGSVFGVLLAKGFGEMINQYFNFPTMHIKMYPELVLPSSLLTLFFCLTAGYTSCRRVFRIMPSEAMRPKSPIKGKKIFIEKIGALWENINYSWKMILRNIFRYKRRALLTSVGVIFATAITLIALGENDSVDFLVYQQYNNIQNYDIKVNFTGFASREELRYIKSLPHVAKVEPVIETGVDITNGWRKKETAYTALISRPDMYKVTDKNGNAVELPSSGILIPDKLAKALDVKPGDVVQIKPFLPGKEEKDVKIEGVIAQYLGINAYAKIDSVKNLLGEDDIVNSVVIRIDDTRYEKEVIDKLKDIAKVSSVHSKTDALNNLKKNMASMTSTIAVMIILASILSIAVIYNITTINIFERQRELATLKVIGFKDSEVKKLIFNENYLVTLFGILIGLPFGKWLGEAMMASYDSDAYTIPFIAGATTYFYAAVLMLLFTFIANMILMKKIRSIDMVEVLKSNE